MAQAAEKENDKQLEMMPNFIKETKLMIYHKQ